MKEKIAYIGHSYHTKTKSTEFLTKYLKEFYEVDMFEDTSWQNEGSFDCGFIDDKYKAVVFFQLIPDEKLFKTIQNNNIIYFPMYDCSRKLKCSDWLPYKDVKIINFSKTLHERLSKWGFNSFYIQYFPEPKEFSPGKIDEVFFWNRIKKISFKKIKKIFTKKKVKIHIHKAIDPNQKFIEPSEGDIENFGITFSQWFETREEMQNLIKEKGLYIAPREYEGIGMSFLEAMAMGKAVIANNKPTMNEYIVHGKNGYLVDFSYPKKIELLNIDEVQKNASEFVKKGYENWIEKRKNIIAIIEKPLVKNKYNSLKLIFGTFMSFNTKSIIRLKIGKNGYFKLLGIDLSKQVRNGK